ncbi:MAG: 2-dehydro-3-deoxyphosphogluconate aldolase [Planctomycetaceae bacterium]|nr:2-dehydro-3-deoxyphosphogluconate aldolase [Planctomycetaceae bacterium]MCH2595057.1 bifunctional 4-hydroxy-2-oxoglutarate aldolase/2-dehydro-3-deoxy-phosphogluconate aldolase [Pirellulales bacterium]
MQTAIEIRQQIKQLQIIPVIALEKAEQADPLADALVAGGLPIAEVTFRTDAAEASIRAMSARQDLLVGAGTVLSVEQVDRAIDAGAQFAVTPGFNPKVVRHCLDKELPIFPGVSSPTEIEMALDHGLQTVKFFPAEALGGLKTLKAIAAPYQMIRFIPTGGIGADNLAEYLAFAPVLACGGSWMVKPALYADGNFKPVESAVRKATTIVT